MFSHQLLLFYLLGFILVILISCPIINGARVGKKVEKTRERVRAGKE
jgi:hypothetical protein